MGKPHTTDWEHSSERWQAYDEHAEPLAGPGLTKVQCAEGALHGASHVWIWRRRNSQAEVLLQRRAAGKPTWGNHLDISAAGHIDAGESPLTAALRETDEEIGLKLRPEAVLSIGVQRAHLIDKSGIIENEFQWLWLAELSGNAETRLQNDEVHSVEWRTFEQFRHDVTASDPADAYVPHGPAYYATIIEAIERASAVAAGR